VRYLRVAATGTLRGDYRGGTVCTLCRDTVPFMPVSVPHTADSPPLRGTDWSLGYRFVLEGADCTLGGCLCWVQFVRMGYSCTLGVQVVPRTRFLFGVQSVP